MSDGRQIELCDLSPDDWIQIKKIAVALLDSGAMEKNQFKITILAFITWIGNLPEDVSILCGNAEAGDELIH